jgi:hypothetical protein
MSVISSSHHKVCEFDSKSSKAFEGNVLLKVIARTREGGKAEANMEKSKCVSAPIISQAEIIDAIPQIFPVIQDIVHSARQQICRALIIDGATEIMTEQIDMNAVVKYLSDTSSGRETTESMIAWFVEVYGDVAIEYVCKAIGFDMNSLSDEQLKQVGQRVNVINSAFAGFASPKYSPTIKTLNALDKFIKFCGGQIDGKMKNIHDKIVAKRDKIMNEINDCEFDFALADKALAAQRLQSEEQATM